MGPVVCQTAPGVREREVRLKIRAKRGERSQSSLSEAVRDEP